MAGPLAGVRVVELAGRGPGPFGVMILSDLGAEVTRVVGPKKDLWPRKIDLVSRGRQLVPADLKDPDGLASALRLIDEADVVVEGFRPGVAERLGLGPDACLQRNPRLIYARITGWGQEGPYAQVPGHDINYVALSGTLDALRRDERPPAPPLNLLGDYGGGGMLLVTGVLAALYERSVSGKGQVVDAAMIDGVSQLTTIFHGMRAEGAWNDEPGSNVLDLGAPFYNVYETADGRYLTIGCGEPQFYASLLLAIGPAGGVDESLREELLRDQNDQATWPAAKALLAAVFKGKTLQDWSALLEGTDTCYAPVLTMDEAPRHPHNVARGTFIEVDGVMQPAPAPRFSRSR
jgi:alpha-methylacyl-CoA racemase